jgi:4-hydroxy-3-methylbut-2-enyl diphosphate reductase
MLIVIGSQNSSNSNRLREIAEKNKKPAYLIDGVNDINPVWYKGINSIGITAGASAPEILVQEVVSYLLDNGANEVIEVSGAHESVHFPVLNTLRV